MPQNKKFLIFLFSTLIIICSGFLVRYISLLAIAQTSAALDNSPSCASFEIHFISLNKSQLERSSLAMAADAQKIGGGGYVWQSSDYYYVLSSGFEKKNDATLVQTNLQKTHNIESELISVKFDALTLDAKLDNESKKVLSLAVNSFLENYRALYDIAISIDTQVYNEISARLAVNNVHAQNSSILANFNTLFAETENNQFKMLGKSLEKQNKILEALQSGVLINAGQTYASLVKYHYISILNEYQNLITQIKSAA